MNAAEVGKITVRPAWPRDADRIGEIHVETWRVAYRGTVPGAILERLDLRRSAEFFHERLQERRGCVFVAEEAGQVVGFCDLVPSRDKDADPVEVAEIAAVYVTPNHWRKGVGRLLCDNAIYEARKRRHLLLTLWTLQSNLAAQSFYKAVGFVPEGKTKVELLSGHELHEVRFKMRL